jgi:hypothetical protein
MVSVASSKQISKIGILLFLGRLFNFLLRLLHLLLGLLFLGSFLLISHLGSHWDGCTGSEASLSLGDELMRGLSSEGLDNLVDLVISCVRLDTAQEDLDILGV